MKSKIVIRILIVCIVLLVIGLIATSIIYFTTDTLKSADTLFKKYYKQDIKTINEILDFSKEDKHVNILSQNNYNDATNVKLLYKNTQDNVEQFDIAILGSTDNTAKNSYRKINVKSGENIDVFNLEYMQENKNYGFLFSDIVKQTVSIDGNNLDNLLSKMNIDKSVFDQFEILNTLGHIEENKKIIMDNFSKYVTNLKGKQFSKEKDKLITLNNSESVQTNAYTLKLTSEQTKKIFKNILKEQNKNNLVNEEIEFSELICTLFVSEGKTVRIILEYEDTRIVMDLLNKELDIKYYKKSENETNTISINIKNENGSKTINYNDQINRFLIQLTTEQTDSTSKEIAKIDFKNESIKILELQLEQNLEIVQNVNMEKSLSNQSNVLLNDLEVSTLNKVINSLLQGINNKLGETNNTINSEILTKIINEIKKANDEYRKLQEQEKIVFNNQFLLYQGQNVEKNVLYNMLDYAGKNMVKYQTYGDNIKIYIEEGKNNPKMAEEIKEKIKNVNENYNIRFQFNSQGKISVILMEKYNKNR